MFGDQLESLGTSGLGSLSGIPRSLLLRLQVALKCIHVHNQTSFLSHLLSQINWEAKGVIQEEGLVAWHFLLSILLEFFFHFSEILDTAIQHGGKGLFFLNDNLQDGILLLLELGVGFAKGVNNDRNKLGKETRLALENLLAVSGSTAQNASKDVAPAFIVWNSAVGNGKRKSASMISNGTVSRIPEGGVLFKDEASVRSHLRVLLNLSEEGLEAINIIIGGFVLEKGYQSFQSHASINVLVGQGRKAGLVSVVLDKHNVPDFNDIRIVGIDESRCIAVSNAIVVDFRARTAGTSLSHLSCALKTETD